MIQNHKPAKVFLLTVVIVTLGLVITGCDDGSSKLLGEWVCVDNPSVLYVKIYKNENTFVFEEVGQVGQDKLPATFKGGVLYVDVGSGEVAIARYDKKTRELVVTVGDECYRFQRKGRGEK